jgi:nucleoside-diphosphate-sugar epimerase
MMRCLVTGGTGFVGAWVVRALRERGYEVTAFDFAPNRAFLEEILGAADGAVRVLDGDVSDLPRLLHAARDAGAEHIVHLAGLLGSASDLNPLRTLRVNCEGTLNVFETALALGVARVVWASSSAVFGGRERPEDTLDNDALHAPDGLYGASKSFNEQLGAHYRRAHGLDQVALRFPVVYGYGRAHAATRGSGAGFAAELFDKPAAGQPGRLPNGDQAQDWLYVEDAARAVCLALEAPPVAASGLNIPGDRRTMREAVECVRALIPGADLEVTPGGTTRPGFDGASAEAAIGYRPQFRLEDGFRRTFELLRRERGLPPL